MLFLYLLVCIIGAASIAFWFFKIKTGTLAYSIYVVAILALLAKIIWG